MLHLLNCRVCRQTLGRAAAVCASCLESLVPCPELCSRCGALPGCGCEGDLDAPPAEITGYASLYLLVGPGYGVVKQWKRRRGSVFDRQLLPPNLVAIRLASLPPFDIVVPVPQRAWRAWALKGSPADALAVAIGRIADRPVTRALEAPPSTVRQSSLRQDDRLARRQAFAAKTEIGTLSGRSVLLVDDILTTGATARAAAQGLQLLGPANILFLALGFRPSLRGRSAVQAPGSSAPTPVPAAG